MMVLIGSAALKRHCGFTDVITKDYDIVGTYDEVRAFAKSIGATSFVPINSGKSIKMVINKVIWEAEIAYPGSSAEDLLNTVYLYEDYISNRFYCGTTGFIVPSLDFLYTLKMSHRYLRNSPHFSKTMRNIHEFRHHGATIPEHLEPFYQRRQKATYDYSHPKLNVMKQDFFTGDGVKYVYDHDQIHEIVKINKKPAYWYFKPQDSQVMVSREMWEELPYDIKLASVIEEAMVLAIERSLVPFPDVLTTDQAYGKALQKVCTSITSGWWREWAWEHYYYAQRKVNLSFWEHFQEAAEDGKILPIND